MAFSRNCRSSLSRPILIGGGDSKAVDVDGWPLPTLVYLAREKRPGCPHHFKAGAMNALLRVSSEISNAPIILNVDCDMYSNDSQSVNAHGFDPFEGILYVGTGCFHRRESLMGRKYSDDFKGDLNGRMWRKPVESVNVLEERGKFVASCTSEENTLWGTEMGLKYGCPVEDVITGLVIQCRGWRSVYFNPKKAAFLGVATATLNDTLIQRKRWSEGNFQIFLSRYCPFVYGKGKISLGLQMCYSIYGLWAPNSLPALFYAIAPSLCLLKDIFLFPKISTRWSIPFIYVSVSTYVFNLVEVLRLGGSFKMWWNGQRMWMIRRVTSYFFAFLDSILKLMGMGEMKFTITSKIVDADETARYENEIMEFGVASPMFIVLTTVALHNLVCWTAIVFKVVSNGIQVLDAMFFQATLCGFIVLLSLPIYEAAFLRRDKGRIPTSVAFISVALTFLALR